MIVWGHVIIEGYCIAADPGEERPCGKRTASTFCLSEGICPYFGYGTATEREVAEYVPLHLIIWDKLQAALYDARATVWHHLWYRWMITKEQKERIDQFLEGGSPQWNAAMARGAAQFPEWFAKARGREVINSN